MKICFHIMSSSINRRINSLKSWYCFSTVWKFTSSSLRKFKNCSSGEKYFQKVMKTYSPENVKCFDLSKKSFMRWKHISVGQTRFEVHRLIFTGELLVNFHRRTDTNTFLLEFSENYSCAEKNSSRGTLKSLSFENMSLKKSDVLIIAAKECFKKWIMQ